jgi:hypothetical protein
VLFGVGIAAVATSAVLLLTDHGDHPASAWSITPDVRATGASLSFGRSF